MWAPYPTALALKLRAVSADALPMTQLQAERFRLVTRSDFDGLVCAALLMLEYGGGHEAAGT